MEHALTVDALAALTGVVAFAALASSPLMTSRRLLLLLQLAAALSFALHYACLGVFAACAANLLGSVQSGAAILAPENRRLQLLGWALVPAMVAVSLIFWAGPISILSSLAMIAIAIGRMQFDETRLRVLILIGGGFWIAHDFLIGAWIAFAADVFCAGFGLFALSRLHQGFGLTGLRSAQPAGF